MAFLNLAAIRECTESEGPGKRFAIWCQGCRRNCPGCCNVKMQELTQKYIVDVKDIIHLILKSKEINNIEGVTFIGGEPMLQAAGFAELAASCRIYELSVMVFTGFQYQELIDLQDNNIKKLLDNTDLLIDGPFLEEQFDTERDWIGSKNQKIYFLTDRYKQGIEFEKKAHKMEVMISEKELLINGWPFAAN